MSSSITLKKGGFTARFSKSLVDYYRGIGGEDYARVKWRRWMNNPGVVLLRAVYEERRPGGWSMIRRGAPSRSC